MSHDLLTYEEWWELAEQALLSSPIVAIVRHAAAYEFELADGRHVTLYPDAVEYPDRWTILGP